MITEKTFVRRRQRPISMYNPETDLDKHGKIINTLVRMTSKVAEIRTSYLRNTNLECYRYTNLPSQIDVNVLASHVCITKTLPFSTPIFSKLGI
jgi:hypothetical protein